MSFDFLESLHSGNLFGVSGATGRRSISAIAVLPETSQFGVMVKKSGGL